MSADTYADSEGVCFTCPECGERTTLGTDWSEMVVDGECDICGQPFEMELIHAGIDFEITRKGETTPFAEGHY